MAIAAPQSKVMTYEDYLTEGEVKGRYDIIDGVRIFMTAPNKRHQRIAVHLSRRFEKFEAMGLGVLYLAPADLLISKSPLRTRQPDLCFVSKEREAEASADEGSGAYVVTPELVIEILSPSDTRSVRSAKFADYSAMGVAECWLVSPESATVQVFTLANGEYHSAQIYGDHETLRSIVFPSMEIALDDIFAD